MKNGTFYLLSNLYDNKTINDADLLNIAYINNHGKVYDVDGEELFFIPEAIVPIQEIDQDLLKIINEDFYDMLMQDDYFQDSELKISDIKLSLYCGLYNGYYALIFQDNQNLIAVPGEENIGGLKFNYPYKGGNTIILWKAN